jgi:hypothetical protein
MLLVPLKTTLQKGDSAMSLRFSRRYVPLVILTLLMLAIPLMVSAATHDPVQGPNMVGSALQWTVNVTGMSGSERQACFRYRTPANTGTWSSAAACSCTGAQCSSGVGLWTCTLTPASTLANSSADWEVTAANNSCNNPNTMGSGTNSFGPTAVALSALSAQGLPVTFGLILPVAGLAVAGGVVLRRSRRS